MPKRKRGSGLSLRDILEKYQDEVFRALKASKGFERQRLSKRLRDQDITHDKKQRIEREIIVLKSLDLHQTARAHLHLSLLKISSIAELPDLPDELKRGVSKPDLPEEEQVALHNVTSGLYNREPVKQAMDRAVKAVCNSMNVPVPETSKRSRKDKRKSQADEPSDQIEPSLATSEPINASVDAKHGDDLDEESEFEGFSDVNGDTELMLGELDSINGEQQETQFEKMEDLLGSSSDEEEDWNALRYAQFRGKETVNLDDISISGSDAESEDDLASQSEESSRSPSPSIEKKPKLEKKSSSAVKPSQVGGSTFLPSLMGGYISGSESASDIEEAKPKKRRGQRARQAIWEQKYGSGAKHLQKPTKGGRDSGWDMRRGAVDGDGHGKKSPWKKGIQRPGAGFPQGQGGSVPAVKPRKRDDEGTLHPSWEARKRARETAKKVEFAGQKVVFD